MFSFQTQGENELFLNYQYKESRVEILRQREGNKKQIDRQRNNSDKKIKYWQNIKKEKL
jgi:hypothetical protein